MRDSNIEPRNSRIRYDPAAYARKRQEAMAKASKLRERRKNGVVDENCTFRPQLQAKQQATSAVNNQVDYSGESNTDSLDELSRKHVISNKNESDIEINPSDIIPTHQLKDSLGYEVQRQCGSEIPETSTRRASSAFQCKRDSTCTCPKCSGDTLVQPPISKNERPRSRRRDRNYTNSSMESSNINDIGELTNRTKSLSLLKSKMKSRRKSRSAPTSTDMLIAHDNPRNSDFRVNPREKVSSSRAVNDKIFSTNQGPYENSDPFEEGLVEEDNAVHTCPDCNRTFNDIAFSKHQKICKKVFQTKRKGFDASKMRVGGTEAEKFLKTSKTKVVESNSTKSAPFGEQPIKVKKDQSWKTKSSALREAMKANRQIKAALKSGKDIRDLPPPKPTAPDPSFIPCPTCKRTFNEKAAERHIPKCAESAKRQSFRVSGNKKPNKSTRSTRR